MAEAGQHLPPVAPGVAAGAVGADREVADQPDRHPRRPRRRLRRGEARIGEELQEGMEFHLGGVGSGEGGDLRAGRVAIGRRPRLPIAERRVLLRKMRVQRFEPGMAFQGLPACGTEGGEGGAGRFRGGGEGVEHRDATAAAGRLPRPASR